MHLRDLLRTIVMSLSGASWFTCMFLVMMLSLPMILRRRLTRALGVCSLEEIERFMQVLPSANPVVFCLHLRQGGLLPDMTPLIELGDICTNSPFHVQRRCTMFATGSITICVAHDHSTQLKTNEKRSY